VCVLPGAEFICIFLNSIIVTIYLFALRAIYAIHESEKELLFEKLRFGQRGFPCLLKDDACKPSVYVTGHHTSLHVLI